MDLVKQITCSLSEKIQHESYGGQKYTSTDLFESESEQVPASFDYDECEQVWKTLRDRVENRIAARKKDLILSLSGAGTHHSASAPPTALRMAYNASSDAKSPGAAPVKTPFRRFPANSEPAKPKEVIPDTPDGQPFP